MHPKGANSMAVSGLTFRNTMVGVGWANSVLLCTNSPRLIAPPFPGEKLLNKQLMAKSWAIASLLMGE